MKKKLLFCLILFSFFMPIRAFALTGDLSISCNSTSVKVGEEVRCKIVGSSDQQVLELFSNISADGSIIIEKFKAERIWEIRTEWPNLSLYSTDKKPGQFEVGTVYLRAKSAGIGNFNMIGTTFTGEDGDVASITNKTVTITVISDNPTPDPTPTPDPEPVKSSDSTLKILNINKENINFNPSVTEYNIEVGSNVDSISIDAVPNDTKANVEIPSSLKLNVGLNTFNIVVTAEDGSTTTYKINVNKLEKILSENALLEELNIDGYSINFSSSVFEYNLGEIDKSSLNIRVKSVDSKATVSIFGNNNIGSNGVIIVKVVAEDGTSNEYVIYASYKNDNTSYTSNQMLIIASSLFVLASFIIVLLVISRGGNKEEKRIRKEKLKQERLEKEKKKNEKKALKEEKKRLEKLEKEELVKKKKEEQERIAREREQERLEKLRLKQLEEENKKKKLEEKKNQVPVVEAPPVQTPVQVPVQAPVQALENAPVPLELMEVEREKTPEELALEGIDKSVLEKREEGERPLTNHVLVETGLEYDPNLKEEEEEEVEDDEAEDEEELLEEEMANAISAPEVEEVVTSKESAIVEPVEEKVVELNVTSISPENVANVVKKKTPPKKENNTGKGKNTKKK